MPGEKLGQTWGHRNDQPGTQNSNMHRWGSHKKTPQIVCRWAPRPLKDRLFGAPSRNKKQLFTVKGMPSNPELRKGCTKTLQAKTPVARVHAGPVARGPLRPALPLIKAGSRQRATRWVGCNRRRLGPNGPQNSKAFPKQKKR